MSGVEHPEYHTLPPESLPSLLLPSATHNDSRRDPDAINLSAFCYGMPPNVCLLPTPPPISLFLIPWPFTLSCYLLFSLSLPHSVCLFFSLALDLYPFLGLEDTTKGLCILDSMFYTR